MGSELGGDTLNVSNKRRRELYVTETLTIRPRMLLVSRPASTLSPVSASGVRRLTVRLGGSCAVIVMARGVRRTAHVSSGATFFLLKRMIRFSSASGLFSVPSSGHARSCVAKEFN